MARRKMLAAAAWLLAAPNLFAQDYGPAGGVQMGGPGSAGAAVNPYYLPVSATTGQTLPIGAQCPPGGGDGMTHMPAPALDEGELDTTPLEEAISRAVRNTWFRMEYQHWHFKKPRQQLIGQQPEGAAGFGLDVKDPFFIDIFNGDLLFGQAFDTSPIDFKDIDGMQMTFGIPLVCGAFEFTATIIEQASDVVDPQGFPQQDGTSILSAVIPYSVGGLTDQIVYEIFLDGFRSRFTSDVWGTEANFVWNPIVPKEEGFQFQPLAGYRYMSIDESFHTTGTSQPDFRVELNSTTRSNLHGPQVGFRFAYNHPWYQFGVEPKVALGVNQYKADVDTVDEAVGDTYDFEQHTVFAAIGSLNVFGKIKVTDHFRFYAAYNLIGASGVSRPHEQVVYDLTDSLETNVHVKTDLGGFMLQGYAVGAEVNF